MTDQLLTSFDGFFAGFAEVRQRRAPSLIEAIDRFFDGFKHERPIRPLNVFRLFNINENEIAHSAVIAWLLGGK